LLYGQGLAEDRSKRRSHLVTDHLRMSGAVQNSECGPEGLRASGEFKPVQARHSHVRDEQVHGMTMIKQANASPPFRAVVTW